MLIVQAVYIKAVHCSRQSTVQNSFGHIFSHNGIFVSGPIKSMCKDDLVSWCWSLEYSKIYHVNTSTIDTDYFPSKLSAFNSCVGRAQLLISNPLSETVSLVLFPFFFSFSFFSFPSFLPLYIHTYIYISHSVTPSVTFSLSHSLSFIHSLSCPLFLSLPLPLSLSLISNALKCKIETK